MGSLSASGIPIASKTNTTFRKRDIRITEAASSNDTVAALVSTAPERTITSGSIVRDNGITSSVEYYEDRVWGVTRMARTTTARIASDESATRSTIVDLNGNQTEAVIETSLAPNTPQIAARSTGQKVILGQSVTDTVIERVESTGVYG